MHAWTRMITNCHTISKVDRGCDRFDSHEKCISDVSYVHVALITLRFFSVPRDKRLRSTRWWAVPWKLGVCSHILIQTVHIYWYKLFTYTETNFLVLKCHQINQEVCSNILDTLYKLQWFQYIYIYIYIYMCGTIWHTFKTSKVALWNVCKIMVVPILPHVCENLIVTKPYDRGVEMANITFLKMTAQHTPPDHKWNEEIWKE